MDWGWMRDVLAVERAGSMLGAAKDLGVTHTTVARRIAKLEEALGLRVFDRIDGRLVATEAGASVVAVAATMEAEMVELDRSVVGHDARLSGLLRVTTIGAFATWFPDAFGSFCRRYPEVELEVVSHPAVLSLDRREADVAVRFTNSPSEHLVGRRVARMEYRLCASSMLLTRLGTRDPNALPWVGVARRLGADLTEARMRAYAPDAHVAARVDSANVLQRFVADGVGIGFLPCVALGLTEGIESLGPIEPDFGLDVWVLTHPDLRGSARVRALMEHLGSYVSKRQFRFLGVEPQI